LSGFSSQVAAFCTNPIDVVKTRLQIQGELGRKPAILYDGFLRSFGTIVFNESLCGLYKGLGASLMREGIYSTIRLGGYDVMKQLLGAHDPDNTPFWKKLVSGAVSGILGSAIATPTDLIKVRMQASETVVYRTCFHGFIEVYQREGFRGLYRGVVPTTQRAGLLTAVQVSTYDHCKYLLRAINIHNKLLNYFLAAVMSGLMSALVTCPVDLIKTRLMNQAVKNHTVEYKSVADCFFKTLRAEGVFGLYKGFFPTWTRIGPHTIITFIVNEHLRHLAGIHPV